MRAIMRMVSGPSSVARRSESRAIIPFCRTPATDDGPLTTDKSWTKKKPSAVAREGFFLFRGLRFWSQGPKRYGVTLRSTTSLSGGEFLRATRTRREVMTGYFFLVVFFVVFFADFFFLAAMALSPPFSAR